MARFHGFMLARDEADILPACLEHLLGWCDRVHVLDNGSQDATPDILTDLARRDARLTFHGVHRGDWSEGLRARMLDAAREEISAGDWLARLDADEWYEPHPPRFVQERVRPWEGRVFAQHFEFVWTPADVAALERSPDGGVSMAGQTPQRLRHYWVEFAHRLEPRLFRFRRGMRWPGGLPTPRWPGVPARARIGVRHYRWRSIPQAQRRCLVRSTMVDKAQHGVHWQERDFRAFVLRSDDPRLRIYDPPTHDLPSVPYLDHLESVPKRLAQRLFYGLGLPALLDGVLERTGR